MWKDSSRAAEACDVMKITAEELLDFGLIDGIIPENEHLMKSVDQMLMSEIKKLKKLKPSALGKMRYEKFRNIDGDYKCRE